MEFPGQGLNPQQSSDNAESLTTSPTGNSEAKILKEKNKNKKTKKLTSSRNETWPKNHSLHCSIIGSSHCGTAAVNPTSILEDAGWIPGLVQWVKNLPLP